MSKRLLVFLFAGIIAFALTPTAWGTCVVTVTGTIVQVGPPATGDPNPAPTPTVGPLTIGVLSVPANLNQEGNTERVSDVLITDDGAGTGCFSATSPLQTIRLTYNALLTSPPSIAVQTRSNFDVYDSAGLAGLAIQASSTTALAPGGTNQTVITLTILQTGTAGNLLTGAAGAGVRVKNLRLDSGSQLAAAALATVTVSATLPASLVTTTKTVGTAVKTILAGAITTPGIGTQSSGAGLTTPAVTTFTEAFAGALGSAFRVAGTCVAGATTCPSGVADDIATTATSLIFDAGTSIPSGVTVTFPATLSTSSVPAIGTAGVIFTLTARGGSGSCTGSAACFVVYDTSKVGATAFTLGTTTVAGVAPNGTPTTAVTPQIGVQIASPSGSGAATLHASFGPGSAAGTGNDDVNANAVPRYVAANTGTLGVGTHRNIFGSGTWFTINAVRTTLLYPFASTLGGFNTGISVGNTGADATAFAGTISQTGGLTLFFWNKAAGVAPNTFSLNTDLSAGGVALPNCRGLDANGRVAPGSVFACALTTLLAAAGQPAAFDGYIIVVTQFNFAHGFSAQFAANGAPFAANNALVMGGATRVSVGGGAEGFIN